MRRRTVLPWLFFGAFVVEGGCSAELGAPSEAPAALAEPGSPVTGDGTADPERPGSDSDPDGTPTDGNGQIESPKGLDCSGAQLPTDGVRRLNVRELNTIAADVLGQGDRPFDVLGTDYGERVGQFLGTTERFVEDHFDVSESVAQRYVADQGGLDACSEAACIVDGLEPTLQRLLRRPVSAERRSRLLELARTTLDGGGTTQDAATHVLWSVLIAPEFLVVGTDVTGQDVQPLPGFELAERLALALWDSVPDTALLEAAASGALMEDAELEAQVRRMLADPDKGGRFLEGFVEAHYDLVSGDAVPPGLSQTQGAAALARDMEAEARALLAHVFEEDLPVERLVQGTSSWMSPRLAAHYGLPEPDGSGQVSLAGTGRTGGLLTMGAVLAQEGDVIHRGVNVLRTFMCGNVLDPDPDLLAAAMDDLPADPTTRQQVEQRLGSPDCAVCHDLIDPLGTAYEVFTPGGASRQLYPDGDSVHYGLQFQGASVATPAEVSELLVDGAFRSCIANQLVGWLSFRRLEFARKNDRCASEVVVSDMGPDAGFQELVVRAVLSPAFRNRVIQ